MVLEGKRTERPPMGFWHGYQNGQATYSDRVIRELMQAKQANNPNPHPDRLLKNVEQFPRRDPNKLSGHAAWNDWPWKLHRIEGPKGITYELYHLQEDPMESNNRIEDNPKVAAEMKNALEQWQRSVLRSWEGADYVQK